MYYCIQCGNSSDEEAPVDDWGFSTCSRCDSERIVDLSEDQESLKNDNSKTCSTKTNEHAINTSIVTKGKRQYDLYSNCHTKVS